MIELRWAITVERMCDGPGGDRKHRKLQYRTQDMTAALMGMGLGGQWSDWQDVPEIEVAEIVPTTGGLEKRDLTPPEVKE